MARLDISLARLKPTCMSDALAGVPVAANMEVSEPLMGCNFPELLAGDLCWSEEVFRSKNLTAGAPAVSLTDDGSRRHCSMKDTSSTFLSSKSRDTLLRMKSLQTVNQDSGMHAMTHRNEEPRKSSETVTSESSGGMEPPSIAGRNVSVTTAATSVTSGGFSPSDKSNSPTDMRSNRSWVNLELEDTINFSPRRRNSLRNPNSPTTPQPPEQDGSSDPRAIPMESPRFRPGSADPFATFSSAAKSFTPTTHSRPSRPLEGSRVMQPTGIPTRRSSLSRTTDLLSLPHQRVSTRLPLSPSRIVSNDLSQLISNAAPTMAPPSLGRILDYQKDEEVRSMLSLEDDDDDESDVMMDLTLLTPKDKQDITTPTIISPLADIEQWVDQSSIELSHLPPPMKDHQGTHIPIAPEVLDTLRISVACFPETMLLCSSLSIETLRGNSKKIRYRTPNTDGASQLSLNMPDASVKSSKWKWLTSRRTPEPNLTNMQFGQGGLLEPFTDGTGSQLEIPDWQAIKNIFPNGTDHLCDALYAHILAYNYISSLCPRSAVISQAARPVSKQSSHPSVSEVASVRSDANRIPLKAACLLGLQNDPSTTIAAPREPPAKSRPGTLRGKTSFIRNRRENTKTFGPVATRSADDYDQSLKDLRLGLAKCIARLVCTLRLTSTEDTTTTSAQPLDIKDVDPLFIRALCEVVRQHEEHS